MQQECNGYKWAGRDSVCHVVSHAVKFLVPIKIKPPKAFSRPWWEIEPDEQALLQAQLPTGLPLCHDLTPINEPNDAALSSNGTANGVAMFVAPLPSDASPGERYLDQLAEHLADEE